MSRLQLRTEPRLGLRLQVQARIKLAEILELPEKDVESHIRQIEADPIFLRLCQKGVLSVQKLPKARYATPTFDGRHLTASDDSLGDLLDGNSAIAKLIRQVGQENFEDCFLGDHGLSDHARAKTCGITEAQARSLRQFIDHLYVRSQFAADEDQTAPVRTYSTVGGIQFENGVPVIGFFNREIWKGRYAVDNDRYCEFKGTLTPTETMRVEGFLRRIELLSFRQTTLYRLLETIIEVQKAYFATGDPAQRVPMTQKEIAARLNVGSSVINALIANKAVETPWHLEIPLKTLLPRRKAVLRDRLYELATENPDAGDNTLRQEIKRRYGVALSRPSIIQYRRELGLGSSSQRMDQGARQ